jgi:hypothetical protein
MLAISAPSITQQRIILVAFVLFIAAVAWWQSADLSVDSPVRKFLPTPLPESVNRLDFTSAEGAWSSLSIDAQGNLQIDALTETALGEAMTLMQGPDPERTMERMAFLLEKQFGRTASRQVMAVLPVLQNYKAAEQRWWAENAAKNPPPHAELFRLQDELLGEALAQQLFSEQRRLMTMMAASQQIRNDTNRTPAEKEQALTDLQKTRIEGAPSE